MGAGSGTYLRCCARSLQEERSAPAFMGRDTLPLPSAPLPMTVRPQASYGISHRNKGLLSERSTSSNQCQHHLPQVALRVCLSRQTPTGDLQGASEPQRPLVGISSSPLWGMGTSRSSPARICLKKFLFQQHQPFPHCQQRLIQGRWWDAGVGAERSIPPWPWCWGVELRVPVTAGPAAVPDP